MKLVSFIHEGRATYGVADAGIVRDAGSILNRDYPDLKTVLAAGDEGLAALRRATDAVPGVGLGTVILLPPIPNPSKILCVGHNYQDHRAEMGRPKMGPPSIFTRFADTQVAHGQPIWIPPESDQVDYEGELAVVIGRAGRRIPRRAALEHVAGYACYDDVSVRDWQRHATQFTPGKNFPHTGAFGPWLVTVDQVPDPQQLELVTRVNGVVMQQARTALMIAGVAELVEYCSTFTPLRPGDVIVSGTPGGVGVGREPPVFLKPGDVVEVEISSIGILRNPVVTEPAG